MTSASGSPVPFGSDLSPVVSVLGYFEVVDRVDSMCRLLHGFPVSVHSGGDVFFDRFRRSVFVPALAILGVVPVVGRLLCTFEAVETSCDSGCS